MGKYYLDKFLAKRFNQGGNILKIALKRSIFIYGCICALLLLLLQGLDYHWLVKSLSTEFYTLFIALIFSAIGIWAGLQITALKRNEGEEVPPAVKESKRDELNISQREMEVLQLMAAGLSNQEIADTLFISQHTVKSHGSNLFSKLNVKRRTQAVQKARYLHLI